MTFEGAVLFIISHDLRLMRRVHRWRAPRWIRLWMVYATRAGDGWIWYVLGAALLLFGGPRSLAAVAAGALASSVGIVIFLNLKKAAGRKRPSSCQPHCWATLFPPDQFSFPSGHTITAFSISVAVACFYPHFAAPLLFCAVSIAASRIVLGMQFLSDVVAGCLIGSILGYFSYWLIGSVFLH